MGNAKLYFHTKPHTPTTALTITKSLCLKYLLLFFILFDLLPLVYFLLPWTRRLCELAGWWPGNLKKVTYWWERGKKCDTATIGEEVSLSYIVTKEKPKGDKNLVRVSWKLRNRPFDTLVQFVGDETLSVELIHGNSKQNKQPRVLMKTSLKAHIERTPMKASALTEQLVLGAGPDKISQLLNTPNNHRQVRQLQSNLRKR